MTVTTRPIARGLALRATLGKQPVRYNAVLVERRVCIMGIVDSFVAMAKGLGLRPTKTSANEMEPNCGLLGNGVAKLTAALALPNTIEVGGRAVAATWTVDVTRGGALRLALAAPGLVEALEGGDGARLGLEGDALVELVDRVERRQRADLADARVAQRAALAKGKAAFLRAVGAKRATLVDDEDEGWPFLRAAGKLSVAQLLARRVPGVLLADGWDYRRDTTTGLRLYAPMTARALAMRCMWPMERRDDGAFAKLLDALEAEAGARAVYVESRTVYLWPTKPRGKLVQTTRLLRELLPTAELEDARTDDYLAGIRAGQMITFRFEG